MKKKRVNLPDEWIGEIQVIAFERDRSHCTINGYVRCGLHRILRKKSANRTLCLPSLNLRAAFRRTQMTEAQTRIMFELFVLFTDCLLSEWIFKCAHKTSFSVWYMGGTRLHRAAICTASGALTRQCIHSTQSAILFLSVKQKATPTDVILIRRHHIQTQPFLRVDIADHSQCAPLIATAHTHVAHIRARCRAPLTRWTENKTKTFG